MDTKTTSSIGFIWSKSAYPSELLRPKYWKLEFERFLTMANDGSYSRAMVSMEDMESFVEHLNYQLDQAANMD